MTLVELRLIAGEPADLKMKKVEMEVMKKRKETTSFASIAYVAVAALFGSVGQIFYKYAANATSDVHSFFFNPYLYLGGFAYALGLVLMLKALRRGELTVVYPVMATSFIWVSLFSPLLFNADRMSPSKWTGIAIIILGVTLVGKGRKR